jgi:hypothetical protein
MNIDRKGMACIITIGNNAQTKISIYIRIMETGTAKIPGENFSSLSFKEKK